MSLKTTNDAKVLVPMTVEALPVNERGNSRDYASLTPQYAKLRFEVRGEKMADEPFLHDSEGLEPGIHLHWALPDGLTHGFEENGELIFPNVPTRWLVLRMGMDANRPQESVPLCKAWIIESDYLGLKKDSPEKRTTTIPTLDQAQPYRYLGKVYEYAQWKEGQEPEKHLQELQAIGPGDPAFAAFYPNCRSVFGFHDADVCGLPPGSLTYLVVGWYPDPRYDPLHTESGEDGKAGLRRMGWDLPEETELIPTGTLCHGMVMNLPWQGIGAEYADGVPGSDLEVAVGNTYVEALSALLGSKFPSGRDLARLLEVVQYELITEWAHPDGIGNVEAKLHERTFASYPGGIRWIIRKLQSPKEEPVFPESIRNALTELNQLQQKTERLRSELIFHQWKTYSVWYRYISETSLMMDGNTQRRKPEEYEEEIERLSPVIQQYRQQIDDLERKRDVLVVFLQNHIPTELPGYILDQKPGPWYWQAQNPVVLLAGEQLQRSFQHGFDHRFDADANAGSGGTLACRVSGQTVSGLRIPWQGQEVSLTREDLAQWNPFTDGKLAREISEIVMESMLLSVDLTATIAEAVGSRSGREPSTDQERARLLQTCQTIQIWHWNAYLHPELGDLDGRVTGTLPSKVGVEIWKAPWTPLFLEWEVQYHPACAEDQTQHILEKWRLDGLDYVWTGTELPGGLDRHYQGTVLLTPSAVVHLQNTMMRVAEHLGEDGQTDQQLLDAIRQLGNLQVLAQGLSGFHTELIQKKEALQLEAYDPETNPALAVKVNEWIDGHSEYAPVPYAAFAPVRAGFMRIIRLWIVDTFGRIQEVRCTTGDPVVSDYLKTPGNDELAGLITLPPRINQPLRLSLTWLRPEDLPSCPTPVCGWILPNYLDNSVMVYNRSGNLLGSLRRVFQTGDQAETQWILPPGHAVQNAAEPDLDDPDLAAFIQGLREPGDREIHPLDELLNYLNDLLGGIDPANSQKEQNPAVFMGRPLVLVRAALRMELNTLPSEHQGLAYLDKSETLGFEKIPFPLRLGDAAKMQDGVAGYFLQQPDRLHTYQSMYAVNGVEFPVSSYIRYNHELTLTCDPGGEETIVTLLMDPGKTVHLRTGILPEQRVTLAEEEYQETLTKLDFHFMAEPVLSYPERFSLPLPEMVDAVWQFIYRTSPEEWRVTDEIINADGEGRFVPGSQQIYEGWLKLTNREKGSEGK